MLKRMALWSTVGAVTLLTTVAIGQPAGSATTTTTSASDAGIKATTSTTLNTSAKGDAGVGAAAPVSAVFGKQADAGTAAPVTAPSVGTTTAGANGIADDPAFPGVWHLYVATTYDGGATWTTVNATPGDPVQRGSICTSGTTCGSTRNLLDFIGVTKDEEGRVLVAYADGCVGACVSGGPNSYTATGVIARQSGGKGLFAAYD
jgi:hypothetical protein